MIALRKLFLLAVVFIAFNVNVFAIKPCEDPATRSVINDLSTAKSSNDFGKIFNALDRLSTYKETKLAEIRAILAGLAATGVYATDPIQGLLFIMDKIKNAGAHQNHQEAGDRVNDALSILNKLQLLENIEGIVSGLRGSFCG